jgi:SagB-type dehydrogenase family enzyme
VRTVRRNWLGKKSVNFCGLRKELPKRAKDFVLPHQQARSTRWKYGERGQRYVYIEAGHAAQNLLLQATALGLGAVPVGAFHDEQVEKLLKLPKDQRVLYLIPVGWPFERR